MAVPGWLYFVAAVAFYAVVTLTLRDRRPPAERAARPVPGARDRADDGLAAAAAGFDDAPVTLLFRTRPGSHAGDDLPPDVCRSAVIRSDGNVVVTVDAGRWYAMPPERRRSAERQIAATLVELFEDQGLRTPAGSMSITLHDLHGSHLQTEAWPAP